ncbi:PBP1A family penicillin-binding protein [Candidatus Parabeggiatoa sp. HSG14]|uniref:penicillin-binding protein 1A n=1 Tax=Candidatus Parabeggiatoa sp. HSG14 TaxID=3055593 RepID=UPI0025A8D34C|nr:PBP1A family penicillin-binding protein [Thiotrichales bacterium HSG14]
MSIRNCFYKTLHVTSLMGLLLILLVVVSWAAIQWYFIPQLPSVENLKDTRLQVPLQIYTKDNVFIAEYGEQSRIPMAVNQVPELFIKAVLAAEDDRFYEHPGVDLKGLFRAAVSLLKTGKKRQGGSTITMQLARNFFLSDIAFQKTFTRKFKEMLLAFKIEEELSKEEILELYLNKIFLGHRAYGVGAAAQIYYGKKIDDLTLAELAMLAGLPKAPSANNPITNKTRALERRNYVLGRMLALGYIVKIEYDTAIKMPLTAKLDNSPGNVDALYVAEMARSFMLKKFKEATYTHGYKVFTTIDSRLQKQAVSALRNALFRYDERHGFKYKKRGIKGVLEHVSIPRKKTALEKLALRVSRKYSQGNLMPSIVLKTKKKSIVAYNHLIGEFEISWRDISWARRYIRDNKRGKYPKSARSVVRRGNVIMVRPKLIHKKQNKKSKTVSKKDEAKSQNSKDKEVRWRLAQIPEIEGALISLNSKDGAITALVGGFDFYQSKFNRVTQAERQAGSTFKPFIYSAALQRGFSHASMVNDAPKVFRVDGRLWNPENYDHRYRGRMTLRDALAFSINVASVRLLFKVGVENAVDHIIKFGFDQEKIPEHPSIALGTADITPLALAKGFAVFANKGFRIQPYFIDHIEDSKGNVVFSANPLKICRQCPSEILVSEEEEQSEVLVSHTDCSQTPRYARRAISRHNAYMMTSMLQDVIQFGTGKQVRRQIKRDDIAGKTGTSNDQRDVWFAGYASNVVTVAWAGFDKPRSLGYKETGGRTALPMWIDFMKTALKGKPVRALPKRYAPARRARIYARKASKKKKEKKSKVDFSQARGRKKSTVIPDQVF